MILKTGTLALVLSAMLSAATGVRAADDSGLDVTMEIVDTRRDAPEAVINRIELPAAARASQKQQGKTGHEVAKDARERGRDHGKSISENAKSRRNANSARENAKGKGKGKGKGLDK
ncbi:MAG: hypothetical protein JSW10_08725 [Pseudomonadota bacterium]|nr:MAG: hypothetical protein JSW10_08725 [Pseudomonadota bacterium]